MSTLEKDILHLSISSIQKKVIKYNLYDWANTWTNLIKLKNQFVRNCKDSKLVKYNKIIKSKRNKRKRNHLRDKGYSNGNRESNNEYMHNF